MTYFELIRKEIIAKPIIAKIKVNKNANSKGNSHKLVKRENLILWEWRWKEK